MKDVLEKGSIALEKINDVDRYIIIYRFFFNTPILQEITSKMLFTKDRL